MIEFPTYKDLVKNSGYYTDIAMFDKDIPDEWILLYFPVLAMVGDINIKDKERSKFSRLVIFIADNAEIIKITRNKSQDLTYKGVKSFLLRKIKNIGHDDFDCQTKKHCLKKLNAIKQIQKKEHALESCIMVDYAPISVPTQMISKEVTAPIEYTAVFDIRNHISKGITTKSVEEYLMQNITDILYGFKNCAITDPNPEVFDNGLVANAISATANHSTSRTYFAMAYILLHKKYGNMDIAEVENYFTNLYSSTEKMYNNEIGIGQYVFENFGQLALNTDNDLFSPSVIQNMEYETLCDLEHRKMPDENPEQSSISSEEHDSIDRLRAFIHTHTQYSADAYTNALFIPSDARIKMYSYTNDDILVLEDEEKNMYVPVVDAAHKNEYKFISMNPDGEITIKKDIN